MNQKSKSEVAA